MLIEEYFARVEQDISSSPFLHRHNLIKDKRSLYIGIIEGTVRFVDNSTLCFMEFVDVSSGIIKYKYSYHYEDKDNAMIFRYDMAPHYKDMATFPHHKHEKDEVVASNELSLKEIMYEIEKMILM